MIRRDYCGPVFYGEAGFGRGGKVFQILKFRTMYDKIEIDQGLASPLMTIRGLPLMVSLCPTRN